MHIKYCSAPCGSGKTKTLIDRACEYAAKGSNILFVQPTKELTAKTVQEELLTRQNPPQHKIFNQDTVAEGSVSRAVADELQGPSDVPRIVFATHQVLQHIKHFGNKSEWYVLIDEELQVIDNRHHTLPKTHALLTDHLHVTQADAIYGRVFPNGLGLDGIAKNPEKDELLETLGETARIIRNPNWRTYVNLERFEAIKRGEGQTLSFHSILTPEILGGFAEVFVVSANFDDTAMFQLWSLEGVEFEEDPQFAASLRYAQHPNGNLITIRYVTDSQWSKKRRLTKFGPDNETAGDLMIRSAKEMFGPNPFVWHANKAITESPFDSVVERLPNKPHGLNSFSNIDNVVFLSSLNPFPEDFHFLRTRGLDSEAIRRAIYCSAAYQAIMRTSIRDLTNERPKTILVPDRPLAEYLHEQFPGSKIEKIEVGIIDEPKRIGRPRRHYSDKEKAAAQRQRARERQIELFKAHLRLNSQDNEKTACGKEWGESRIENGIRLYRGFDTQLLLHPHTVSIFKSVRSPSTFALISCETFDHLVEVLRRCHQIPGPEKSDNYLFSTAIFDPTRSTETKRGKANIVRMRNVVLDFENGKLRPNEIANVFPSLRMVVTNTFSHSSDKPRFRVIIETNENMNADTYEVVCACIAEKLEDAGYSVAKTVNDARLSNTRASGLDWSKTFPHSLFYLPSQGEKPADRFFFDYAGSSRSPIVPSTWLQNIQVPLQPEIERVPAFEQGRTQVNAALVEAAIRTWRSSTANPGQGNQMFFDLALALRRAGMNLHQIEATLHHEAQYGRTPTERQAQIPSIIKTLRKSLARVP